MTEHPPKPRLVLNVGVTGHLARDLQRFDITVITEIVGIVLETIRERVDKIHREAGSLFTADRPLLRLVSRMADGADLLVAAEAAQRGYELQCALPFERRQYATDIDGAAVAAYWQWVGTAAAVFELDGATHPAARKDAFLEGRRAVLRHSDVLIAIWDPGSSTGAWGTTQIIKEARRDALLTIQIRPGDPRDIGLELGLVDSTTPLTLSFTELEDQLRRVLLPLDAAKPRSETSPHVADYFAERRRRVTLGFLWRLVRDWFGKGEVHLPRLIVQSWEVSAAREWTPEWETAPQLPIAVTRRIDEVLFPHFAWLDGLANYYADLTRSSIAFIYGMGATAVLLALGAYALGWTDHDHPRHVYEALLIGLELGVILLIIATALVSRRRRWHERWIDYRLVAEQLRLLRCLVLLGRSAPFTRLPAHLSHADARGTWMHWLSRAITRSMSLVTARLDVPAYREGCRRVLTSLVERQKHFHADNARTLRRAERNLYVTGVTLSNRSVNRVSS